MTVILRLLRRISERLGVAPDDSGDERTARLAEETNVYELMQTLERELPRTAGGGEPPESQLSDEPVPK